MLLSHRLRQLATLALLVGIVRPALSQGSRVSAAEFDLFRLANADRARYGLAPLRWDPDLAAAARNHALRLLREPGELEHQYPGEPDLVRRAAATGARFSTVSENLARADLSPASIEDGWMHSPPHRHNLLNPNLDAIGISVLAVRGRLFAVEDFARAVPVRSLLSIERDIAQSLLARGLAVVSLSQTARLACRTADQRPVDPARGSPRAVVAWDAEWDIKANGSETARLPNELLEELDGSRLRTRPRIALVGACPVANTEPGFSGYRIAVLLY